MKDFLNIKRKHFKLAAFYDRDGEARERWPAPLMVRAVPRMAVASLVHHTRHGCVIDHTTLWEEAKQSVWEDVSPGATWASRGAALEGLRVGAMALSFLSLSMSWQSGVVMANAVCILHHPIGICRAADGRGPINSLAPRRLP